jgi:hypothetical protein
VSFEPFSGALQVLEKEELKYKINRAIDYLDIR